MTTRMYLGAALRTGICFSLAIAAANAFAQGYPPRNGQIAPAGNVAPAGNAPGGNAGGGNPAGANQPEAPGGFSSPMAPFDLSPAHQKYLDDVLKYWEYKSSLVERYRCQFQRMEYDPVFGPKDPDVAKSFGAGVIKYAQPDKGLFKVEQVLYFTPPKNAGEKPQYLQKPGVEGEQWICDGQSIFEFDTQKKQLIERELPPEMQGTAIAEGPLPFLFGAKADKIKARFWLRIITPKDVVGEYWIEAWPKFREDATNFKLLQVIIDEKDYLPKAIQVFAPNYDERRNPARTTYLFDKREVNWPDPLAKMNLKRDFYRPATPVGWTKVVEKHHEITESPRVPAPGANPGGPGQNGPATNGPAATGPGQNGFSPGGQARQSPPFSR